MNYIVVGVDSLFEHTGILLLNVCRYCDPSVIAVNNVGLMKNVPYLPTVANLFYAFLSSFGV